MPRRRAAVALAVALLLPTAACSGGSGGVEGPRLRTVEHAMGTTLVPEEPERVVVLDAGELDAVAALGITPVGAPRTSSSSPVPEYVADALGPGVATITSTGTIAAPDLEAVRALQPDVILTNRQRHGRLYAQLSAIAPTVMAPTAAGEDWKDRFLLDAEALGRRSDAELALEDYETRADQVARAWRDPSALPVGLVRFVPRPSAVGDESFAGAVLSDVGFASTGSLARAQLLFSSGAGPVGVRAASATARTATWRALPAVRSKRSVQVADDIWFRAIGPVGARLLLDDLLRYAEDLAPGRR